MTSNDFLFFLGSLMVGCVVALFLTHKDYRYLAEPFMIVLTVSSFLMGVVSLLKNRK